MGIACTCSHSSFLFTTSGCQTLKRHQGDRAKQILPGAENFFYGNTCLPVVNPFDKVIYTSRIFSTLDLQLSPLGPQTHLNFLPLPLLAPPPPQTSL